MVPAGTSALPHSSVPPTGFIAIIASLYRRVSNELECWSRNTRVFAAWPKSTAIITIRRRRFQQSDADSDTGDCKCFRTARPLVFQRPSFTFSCSPAGTGTPTDTDGQQYVNSYLHTHLVRGRDEPSDRTVMSVRTHRPLVADTGGRKSHRFSSVSMREVSD
jgi:hypothetical protein